MKKSMKVSSALLSIVLLSNTLGVSVYADEGEKPLVTQDVETDQVIVTFKENVQSEETDLDVVSVKALETEEVATLKVPEGETVDAFIEELEERKDIESVEPDHLVQLSYTPNDPYFTYQYFHQNIETERAWEKTKGSSDVVVAVLDSGFDINHRDLANQIVAPSSTSYTGFSVDNHGTHVAGIIGSSIDNYTYGAGVAPKTSIMPIDVFYGEWAYTSDVIEGIYQAVWAGADIINMSLGSYNYSTEYNNAIQYAYQSGLVIVAAAGNDSTSLSHYPSSYDNVISVGSTDSTDYQSYFSNYGYDIDIVAPGSSIYSTLPYNSGGWMSGTSMASPVVAGVAALVMANEPNLTNNEVVDRLLTTTKDLGDYGKDYIYGNGLVNAKQALKIIDIPAPTVFGISDSSTIVSGYVLADIRNGTIVVRDQYGNTIGSQENYNGYTYFDVAIPQQPAGTALYVIVMDSNGNESEAAGISVIDGRAPSKPDVDEVTDESTYIIGGAEPYAEVIVSENGNVLYTSWVDKHGFIYVPINRLKAGTVLSITVRDAQGNISEPTEVTVKDATAPAKPQANEVTEKSVEVTGTAEAGTTVTVKAKGVLLGTAEVDGYGNYSIGITKQKAGTLLVINSTDEAGNISEATEIKVKDTTAPVMPTVSEVTDKSTAVKGTAEAGAIVLVNAGGVGIGKATASSDGSFAVTIAKQKAGTKLTVTATDAARNASAGKVVTVLDATAPIVPTVDSVTDKSTAVTGTGEVNASISVKVGNNELGTAKVAADGKYKVAISVQQVGTKIQVAATDAAGNTSLIKETIVADATAPKAPVVNTVTDQSTIITGTAEVASKIIVTAGNKEIGTATVSTDGKYSAAIPKQKGGTALAVIAMDKAGNKSAIKTIKVIDKTAPSVPSVNAIGDNSVAVSGKAESGAKVYAYAGNKKLGEAVAKDGSYSIKIAKQKARISISIHAIDTAGNKSGVKTVKVVDKTAPSVPTVNTIGDNSTAVSGKAESGAKVYAYVGSKKLGEATAKNGAYSIKIAKQKAGTSIAVYAVDPAKNKSGSKTVKVADKTAPAVPTVNKVTSKSTAVSGKGEKAATVMVYNGSKKIAQGTVDGKGNFNVKISKQKKGVSLKIQLQDKAGNKSGSKTMKVN